MKPKMILQKNADKTLNRIMIPKSFIEKFGNQFYMEIYENYIILKPINENIGE